MPRSEQLLQWYYNVLSKSHSFIRNCTDQRVLPFLVDGYAGHAPLLLNMTAVTPAWTIQTFRDAWGTNPVQVQTGRDSDPDFERRSALHRDFMPANTFLDLIEGGAGNNVYLTANNAEKNRALCDPLLEDFRNILPPYMTFDPGRMFIWLGGDTMTPLHFDLTNNLLWQVFGSKVVRVISPLLYPRLEINSHVHSDFVWPDDNICRDHGLVYRDIELLPGHALFLPVGWCHAVMSVGPSCMLTMTNFIWPNHWNEGFPP